MRKYMGCVTDKSFSHALLEQYPNRKPGHPDAQRRKEIACQQRDVPELVEAQARTERLRFFMDEVNA